MTDNLPDQNAVYSKRNEAPMESTMPGGMTGQPGPLLRLVSDQRIAFLLIGGVNTAVGYGWFVLFNFLFRHVAFGYLWSLGFAHIFSVLCAFVLYRRFVFRVRGHVWRDLGRFELVYLVSILINFAVLPLLVEFAHLNPLVAQASIIFLTTMISYFGHRRFSFRRPAATPATTAPDHDEGN